MSSVFTLANLLTILRLLLVPVFVMAVYYQHFGWALALFVTAAITDGLDGLVARAFNQKTELGAILDPMADKLLLVTAFIILSLHGFTLTSPVPFWVTVAAISRDVFIVLGALVINVSTGFSNFRPSWPGKVNTFVEFFMIVLFLATNALRWPERFLFPAFVITFGMCVFSGIHYIFHVNRQMNEKANATPSSKD